MSRTIALLTSIAFSLPNFRGTLIEALVARGHRVLAMAPDYDDRVRARVRVLGIGRRRSYAAGWDQPRAGRTRHAGHLTEGVVMGIGIGILLLVIGLILLFAIKEFPASLQEVVEPTTVGWILVIAGVLALVLGLVMNNQRSKTTHVEERRDM